MNRAASLALALALVACAGTEYRDTAVPITAEAKVDLDAYQGRWFEIARFPVSFEEGCEGVTADYTLNADGTVRVVNTCRQGSVDGPAETAEGVARAVDGTGAKLKVTFVPWLPFAEGDYWILALDRDAGVSVVGSPAGTSGWILARTPTLPAAITEWATGVLAANGYDVTQLRFTDQPPG